MNQYQLNLLETVRQALVRASVFGITATKMHTLTKAIEVVIDGADVSELTDEELVLGTEEAAEEPAAPPSEPVVEITPGAEVVTQQISTEVDISSETPAVSEESPAVEPAAEESPSEEAQVAPDETPSVAEESPAEQPTEQVNE